MGKIQETVIRQRSNSQIIDTWLENIALFVIFLAVLFLVPAQW
jgi:hypothetical protein